MIDRLDAAVLARIERACHGTQVSWGMTCFSWARICHLAIVLLLFTVTGYASPPAAWPIMAPVCTFAWMYANIVWGWYHTLETFYAEFHGTAHPMTMDFRSQVHVRAFVALATVGLVAYGLGVLDGPQRWVLGYALVCLFWLAALYLQCCIPLPPGDVKSRQMEREAQEVTVPDGAVSDLA